MKLSKTALPRIHTRGLTKPDDDTFNYPVKIIQFGTGVLLRGLIDYLIDKANRNGFFSGRILVVKSTASGDKTAFDEQDNLYTLWTRGIEDGKHIEEKTICAAISQVISAVDHWDEVLRQILNPELKIIISNTTEIGIQLAEEDIHQSPPASYPAKLLALLYKRYIAFNGSIDAGFVIIPTELIPDNGVVLKAIILQLIRFNKLPGEFEKWINEANYFCSSLVDRIVPGRPEDAVVKTFESEAGYSDKLLTVSEVYRLWAISGNEKIKTLLGFGMTDKGIIITPDIAMYRELKLRLLNGTHTLCCALAFLSGFKTVNEAMDDPAFLGFARRLMSEISAAIPYQLDSAAAAAFSEQVLDRFRNPYIRHQWINITQQFTTKLRMRVLPVLLEYYRINNKAPVEITKGFAAFIAFMRPLKVVDGTYRGEFNQNDYPIADDKAVRFFELRKNGNPAELITDILKDETLWGADLSLLPGFADTVQEFYGQITTGAISILLANGDR
ncbi:MAG: tagaturonate reductase [Bacteroidota bacterium]|nr:tagaturonate reductase [Bacteroidota bacterium]